MPTSIQVAIIDGKTTTTSLDLAEHFGRRHKDILKAISRQNCSDDFNRRNFALSEYVDGSGRKLPMYIITRDGFTMLAMGFTGRNADQWKEAYINAFNEMEKELLTPEIPAYYKQELLAARPLWRKVQRFSTLGLTNVEISKVVDLHPSTVRKHIRRMERLGILQAPKNLTAMQQMSLRLTSGGEL